MRETDTVGSGRGTTVELMLSLLLYQVLDASARVLGQRTLLYPIVDQALL